MGAVKQSQLEEIDALAEMAADMEFEMIMYYAKLGIHCERNHDHEED